MHLRNKRNGISQLIIAGIIFASIGCSDGSLSPSTDNRGFLGTQELALSPALKIAEYLKDTVAGVTSEQMNEMMISHYKQVRLINESGAWALPELEEISDFLLPGDIDEEQTFAFIDHMASAAEDNEYLVDFLNKAQNEDFFDYMSKVDEEGDSVFPDALAYAHALERLTIAMREDWRIIRACRDLWIVEREIAGISEYMDLFEHLKLASVEWPMNKIIDVHEADYVPSDFLKGILPINILEAVALDLKDGFGDNACAGTYLAKYKPGKATYDARTGEGPSCFSDDGKAILLNMALPRKWANLYATWNLAFVTSYAHPYIMAKLLIPSVNDYKEVPAEYIYNRGMALYTHIHWELLHRVDFINAGKEEVFWPDEHLTRFWGQANKAYGKQYNREVLAAKYPWLF
jgi:hypothetical protein